MLKGVKMNFAFCDYQLCEGESTNYIFHYAFHHQNEKNKSYIFYDKYNKNNNKYVIEKLEQDFHVYGIDYCLMDIDDYLIKYNIKEIFLIKSCDIHHRINSVSTYCIHYIYPKPPLDEYKYCFPWFDKMKKQQIVVTPPSPSPLPKHDENMRTELNIPENAIVFGLVYKSTTFFNLFIYRVIFNIIKYCPNIYFIFVNDRIKSYEINIINLSKFNDLHETVKFINTCDAIIWGLNYENIFTSIEEISKFNIPIIAHTECEKEISYSYLFGPKIIWYSNEDEFTQIFINFYSKSKDHKTYFQYLSDKMMNLLLSYQ